MVFKKLQLIISLMNRNTRTKKVKCIASNSSVSQWLSPFFPAIRLKSSILVVKIGEPMNPM